ncbi:MFS transporter [Microbispora bryophytorum]|uniref:MFS transporter n=1 Tax=Microbispora bryophytorum TaxID=1460882 RepID=UPI0033EB0291
MTPTSSAAPPAAPARARALTGIALGYFMVLLDTTVLSVAEPDLARSFGGAGVAGLQWTVTGYTLVFGAALLTAGSVAGGALTDLAGWRAIFLINAPLAAVTLALTAGAAVRCPRGDRRIDWAAQILACAAVALLTDTLIALGAHSFVHAAWSAGATAVAVCAFAVRERQGHTPVLAPAVLRRPGIPGALLAGAAVNFAMSGVLFVLPLLFQQALGLTPGQIGAALLPMTLPFAVNPLLTGRIVARSGPRPPVLAGLGLLTAGGVAFGAAVWAGASYPLLLTGLVATGFGVSSALPPWPPWS